MEVKCVESLNLYKAIEQAKRDAGEKHFIVAHKRNGTGFHVTMSDELLFALLRGGMDEIEKLTA
jgi:hypothetical protein